MEFLRFRIGDFGPGIEIEERVEFREEEREADRWKMWVERGRGGDWYWSQKDSEDSVVLSRVLPGVEVEIGWGSLNSGSFTCSREICAASSKIDSGPFMEVLADVST